MSHTAFSAPRIFLELYSKSDIFGGLLVENILFATPPLWGGEPGGSGVRLSLETSPPR